MTPVGYGGRRGWPDENATGEWVAEPLAGRPVPRDPTGEFTGE